MIDILNPRMEEFVRAGGLTPMTNVPARDEYRGWTINQGRWPEPAWMATSPNYDASYEGEEDGFVDNGEKADAPTREALLAEIDAWFEEQAA